MVTILSVKHPRCSALPLKASSHWYPKSPPKPQPPHKEQSASTMSWPEEEFHASYTHSIRALNRSMGRSQSLSYSSSSRLIGRTLTVVTL
ncbi:hypothetical protein FRC15_009809 [Serendipita sp. 397]|nr:hypothetical protein FRC15_009809 [Serendipita sp. 397]